LTSPLGLLHCLAPWGSGRRGEPPHPTQASVSESRELVMPLKTAMNVPAAKFEMPVFVLV